MSSSGTLEQRFWDKVRKSGGCWLWIAHRHAKGYGQFWAGGRMRQAHRVSWELHNGPIPEGLDVLHACDTPPRVKPGCLFLGTNADNVADRQRKGRSSGGTSGRPPVLHGEDNSNAKLAPAQVIEIRSRCGQSQSALAKEFGVSQSHIHRLRSGKRWAHLDALWTAPNFEALAHALG